jgi:uncharacterized protein (TIGR00730 family)
VSKATFSIAVYCGSKMGSNPVFSQVATQVGQWIGERKGQLVYGGGNSGLMGVVANATLQAGGRVLGIIPDSMVEREWAHHGITELRIVQNMHERKAQMIAHSDALLALPGGIGTLDEFFEAWTWRQLGYHHKPVGLLNADGFYDGLLGFLRNTVSEDFLGQPHFDLLHLGREIHPLLTHLVQAAQTAPAYPSHMDLS